MRVLFVNLELISNKDLDINEGRGLGQELSFK